MTVSHIAKYIIVYMGMTSSYDTTKEVMILQE